MERHSGEGCVEGSGRTVGDREDPHAEIAGNKEATGASTPTDSSSDNSLQTPPVLSPGEGMSGDISVTSHTDWQSYGGHDPPHGDDGIIRDSDLEEPKMCIEETATYWSAGGGESRQEDFLTPDGDNMAAQRNRTENGARLYFPLQKTLQNLRLLDLKLKYSSRQATGDKRSSTYFSEPHSRSPEENPPQSEKTHSLGLIALLSQCHLKLQQMEELRLSSAQLARSLWEAQETISYLKENVAALHRENAQKENAIFSLSKELMEAKSLLYEKSERIADMEAMFSGLADHLQSRPSQQGSEEICQMNAGDPGASRICAIL
ncbi:uncharacterized protein LOC128500414 [Spea bombifrons]|uniref:uncharacterized protein LOC128500414 n=1 Tax=Spea bombifrons TaxID=233779 RepID=UPI00234AA23B|nr:uncharacterized protein LOC128500414 [Spea bombifrons]